MGLRAESHWPLHWPPKVGAHNRLEGNVSKSPKGDCVMTYLPASTPGVLHKAPWPDPPPSWSESHSLAVSRYTHPTTEEEETIGQFLAC